MVQIHTRWHMRMLLPVATALVGVSVEDSAVSTIRKSSVVVRLCPATLHSTRELWFCWELTSAFYQDMRNNQDIHDTNSPANDLDSSKQPEGSRKQHSLSYCGTMVSQKYPQSYHTSPCRPTYLGALLMMSGHTTPKGRTHQPDKQL